MLEGQWREYLEYAMEQYRNGGRSQPERMASATGDLKDDEWDALLHYYASGS
jgi:sulfide dehydrogenase cytochrome subunit